MTGSAGKEKLSLCLGDLSMCSPKICGRGLGWERSVVSLEEGSAVFELKRTSATTQPDKPRMGEAGWSCLSETWKEDKSASYLISWFKSAPEKGRFKEMGGFTARPRSWGSNWHSQGWVPVLVAKCTGPSGQIDGGKEKDEDIHHSYI